MTWVKIDDGLALHPKVVAAGNSAMGLWLRSASWSGQQLTEGVVPAALIPALAGRQADVEALLQVGLWTPTGSAYEFHDWTDYNPTKAKVLEQREAATRRQSRARTAAASRKRDEQEHGRDAE